MQEIKPSLCLCYRYALIGDGGVDMFGITRRDWNVGNIRPSDFYSFVGFVLGIVIGIVILYFQ
ncbi:MAG: hypothetical protein AAB837_02080 [Patescibacteria group bacterium]